MRGMLLAALVLIVPVAGAAADEALWARMRVGGLVVAIRHASAPGTGDPTGFRLGDCSTQRNLSGEGRAQAQALGKAFRTRDIPVARVLASRWCRTLETARLAFGEAEEEPALDSLFGRRDRAAAQSDAVRSIIDRWPADGGNLVLVTHQANIAALVGAGLREGEMVILTRAADGGFAVVGRMLP